jgi:isoquinoline 1-oxidoreductase beta subunit
LKLTDLAEFRHIGKEGTKIVDGSTSRPTPSMGRMSLPGMKFAVVARPPVLGGK